MICSKCQIEKPETEFYWNKGLGRFNSYCKTCQKSYVSANKRGEIKIRPKRKFSCHQERVTHHLRSFYLRKLNFTMEQFESLFVEQTGNCAICNREFTTRKSCHIDHNHATGKVRGLLCGHCNKGIGFFKENIAVIKNAVHYIEKYNGI